MSLDFIHRYIEGTSSRTLLMLHGTGGDENDLIALGQSLDPAASILSPRGRVDEQGANRFFRRLREGVFDEANLKSETAALAAFVAEAATTYGFDPLNVVAIGFSNGANVAASLLLLHPEVLRGGFLLRSMVPLQPDTKSDLSGKSVLMTSGRHDPIVPTDTAEGLATLLKERGADVTHTWLPTGHQLTREDFELGKAWLDRLK